MSRLGRDGLAARAWRLLYRLTDSFRETEHLAMVGSELVKAGIGRDVVGRLVESGRRLEEGRSHQTTVLAVGVALFTVGLGEVRELAERLVDGLLLSPAVRQKSLRFNMLESEARLLGNGLKTRPGLWVTTGATLRSLGPIELGLEAWRKAALCQKSGVQDPGLLAVGPRLICLQLRAAAELVALYNHV